MKFWDLSVISFHGLNARLLTLMPPTHFDWWRLGLLDLTKRVICSLRGLSLLVRVDCLVLDYPLHLMMWKNTTDFQFA